MNRNVIEHPKNYPWKDRSSVIQYQLNRKHEKNLLYMVLFIGGFNPSIREDLYMNAVRFAKEILNFQITACLLQ